MADSSNKDFTKTEDTNGNSQTRAAFGGAQAEGADKGVGGSPAPAADGKDKPPANRTDADKPPLSKEIKNPPRRNEMDPNGCPIVNVFASTRQFAIYEADDQIRYMLPEDYEVAKALRKRISDLGGLRASIEDLRADKSISSGEKTRAAREISWALVQAFEDEGSPPSDKPKEILTRVDARLRSLVKSHYRKKYVFSNLAAFIGIEMVLILLAIITAYSSFGAHTDVLHRYAIYCAFGGLGAFLSVVTGVRSIEVDVNLKVWEHMFAGATRILIGVVGALIVGLALDSRFIDPTFGGSAQAAPANSIPGSLDQQLALRYIFAFIAGFSESLVPNLLRRGEQVAGAAERQGSPNDPIVKDMKP